MTTLAFSAGRLAWLAVPMALLIALSYGLNPASWRDAPTWVYVVLGGFFAAVLLLPLVLRHRCWLQLDREGIEVHMWLRHERWRWRDIEGFVTASLDHGPVPMTRFVGVNFRTAPPKLPALAAGLMQRMNGYHRSVPAWFGGLNAPELAVVLERARRENLGLPPLEED